MEIKIITGLAGAGKSALLNCFEDEGYYCIDNLPPKLLFDFLDLYEDADNIKIALVMDLRLGSFFKDISPMLKGLKEKKYNIELIFIESSINGLMERFTDTRRSHPLENEGLSRLEAIKKEIQLMSKLRASADTIIDTTDTNIHGLKKKFLSMYSTTEKEFVVYIISFGFKKGYVRDCEYVFDTRFIKNPYYEVELRELTGYDERVLEYVYRDEKAHELTSLIEKTLAFAAKNKKADLMNSVSVGIGCTGGKHRSVAISNVVAKYMQGLGYKVIREDRELK